MNFSTSVELKMGSARTSRPSICLFRGIRFLRFRPLGPVLRPALLPIRYARRIERSAHHVIADSGEILDAAAANQHDRMLLQIVPHAGYISGYFDSVGQTHAGHFSQSRIGLLGS